MYDISQLNDMLVPELQDIAIEQNISNPKKLDKQELISQILTNQSAMSNVENNIEGDKPKRKRIRKPLVESANTDDQPQVAEEKPKQEVRIKKTEPAIEKKKTTYVVLTGNRRPEQIRRRRQARRRDNRVVTQA